MRSRTIILVLCCVIYILGMFHRSSPGVLASELMHAFDFSAAGFGLVGGSTMLGLGLLQLPSGVLSDAWGCRRVIFWLTLLAGLGSLGFGLAHNFNAVLASRFLVGLGIAISVPVFALLAETFPVESYGRALSIVTASGGLGTILAAPPLLLLASLWGWRGAVIFFSVLTLLTAVLFKMHSGQDHSSPRPAASKAQVQTMLAGIAEVFRTPAFWPLCVWQLCIMGCFFMLVSLWWIPYLTDAGGCTPMQASTILLIGSVFVILMQPVLAWLSDVCLRARKTPLTMCTMLSFAAALAMVFFTGRMNYITLLLHALLLTMAMLASPLLLTMVKESFPPRLAGTALGCVNMLYPLWTAILQTLFGLILQAREVDSHPESAYAAASLIVVVNIGAGLVASFFMRETWGRAAPDTPIQS